MKNHKKQKLTSKIAVGINSLFVMVLLVVGLFVPITAYAQVNSTASIVNTGTQYVAATDDQGHPDDEVKSEIKKDCEGPDLNSNCQIVEYLLIFINVLTAAFAVIVIIVIIIAGIQYSASAGDPQAVAAAKQRITNALIAIAVFGGMYGFLQWIVPGGIF
jgi:hypothetical protein